MDVPTRDIYISVITKDGTAISVRSGMLNAVIRDFAGLNVKDGGFFFTSPESQGSTSKDALISLNSSAIDAGLPVIDGDGS